MKMWCVTRKVRRQIRDGEVTALTVSIDRTWGISPGDVYRVKIISQADPCHYLSGSVNITSVGPNQPGIRLPSRWGFKYDEWVNVIVYTKDESDADSTPAATEEIL